MDERTRRILKGQIVSILHEAGEQEENLRSRIVCERIANRILEDIRIYGGFNKRFGGNKDDTKKISR